MMSSLRLRVNLSTNIIASIVFSIVEARKPRLVVSHHSGTRFCPGLYVTVFSAPPYCIILWHYNVAISNESDCVFAFRSVDQRI